MHPIFKFVLMVICIWFVMYMLMGTSYRSNDWEKEYEIVSLRDSTGVQGSFFIGSGYIKDRSYYIMYAIVNKDTYTQVKIPAEMTLLTESDDMTPQVLSQYKMMGYIDPTKRVLQYKLIVPKNTIIRQFQVE